MYAFLLSTAVIFVAELGDKSQLMALTFATRFRALPVLVGIGLAGHRIAVPVCGRRTGIEGRSGRLDFVLEAALSKLVHLSFGLAAILFFIGAKLVLHWSHLTWPSVPEIPTVASLFVIVGILAITTVTSLMASKKAEQRQASGTQEDTEESTEEDSRVAR